MEAVAGSRRRELLGLAVVVRRRDRLRLSPPTPASCRRLRSRPPADRQRVRFFGSRRSTGGTGDTCSPAIASAPRQGCWGGRLRRVVTFVWPGRRGNSFTMALLSLALPAAGCGGEPSTPSKSCRAALVEFATRYNETWLVARHGYRTPAKVRADQCRIDQNATADLKLAA